MKFNGKIYPEGWTPETPYYEERVFLTANETVKKAVSARYAVLVKGEFIPANTIDEVKKVWETAPHALVFMIRPYKAETETAETGVKKGRYIMKSIESIVNMRNALDGIRYGFYRLIGHPEKFKSCCDRVPTVHISKGNMKLGDIPSFSLTPGVSCTPEACKTCLVSGCYACKSYKMYPSVRNSWDDNTFLVTHDLPRVERELTAYFDGCNAPRFFRVHVAGDFITKKYAMMWSRVATAHPHTFFLAFTKQWDKIRGVKFPSNFTIMLSDWPGTVVPEDLRKTYNVAWLDDGTRSVNIFPENALECPGHCENCGACWNLKKDTIFHKH